MVHGASEKFQLRLRQGNFSCGIFLVVVPDFDEMRFSCTVIPQGIRGILLSIKFIIINWDIYAQCKAHKVIGIKHPLQRLTGVCQYTG
jgi:hypothetical protein